MSDRVRTKEQLIGELARLRQRITELEAIEAERKKAEEALRQKTDQQTAVLSSIPAFVYLKDTESKLISANDAFAAMVNTPIDQLPGKDAYDLFPKAQATKFHIDDKKVMESGKAIMNIEEQFTGAAGKTRWASSSKVPYFDEKGKVIGMVGITWDITGRKRVECRIEHMNLVLRAIRNVNQLISRESNRERLLKSICNILIETGGYYNVWIFLLGEPQRAVLTVEAGWGEDFLPMAEKLKRGDLTACGQKAMSQSSVVITEDPLSACIDCPLSAKYRGRGALTVRLEHSGEIYGLLSASIPRPLINDQEEQILFEEVAGDIAFALYGMELEEKSKQAEERLQQAYNELEVRVKERTAEIERTTRELHAEAKERSRVSKQLRKSLKEKETLLQEVHHRVKNNLQVISSLLDLSSLRVHDQQATNMLTDARTRIYTMSLIHSQLYTSERLDKVEMGRHVRELVNYLSEVYEKQKGITTVIEIPDIYLPVTQAIPCATVLSELISNAIKHAFRGKPEGMVEISMNKSDESIIIVRVKDDGIGIPGEVDIDKTNSLGLKLVRNMVRKQLGGKIRLVRNGGSEFIVEFKIQG